MTRRTILYLLLFATLIYRGSFFFEIFGRIAYPGVQWKVEESQLTVAVVVPQDPFGRPTVAHRAGLKAGDHILRIQNDKGDVFSINGLNDFSTAFKKVRDQDGWLMVLLRNGREVTLPVRGYQPTDAWRWKESLLTITWTTLLPLVALFTAFFIGFSKPQDNHAFLACLLFLCFSTVVTVEIYLLPQGLREFCRFYETTANIFLPYCFMRFFLLFPSASWIERKASWLKHVFLGLAGMMWITTLVNQYALYHSFELYTGLQRLTGLISPLYPIEWFGMLVIGLISLVSNTLRPQSRDEKRKMVILLLGVVIGVLLPGALIAIHLHTRAYSILLFTAIAVSLAVFPAAFAYVVIRHRVLGIRLIIRRGLQYLLVSRAVRIVEIVLIFLLLYFLVRPALIPFVRILPPMLLTALVGGLTLAVFFAIRRLNQPIMLAIDRKFFRQSYDARQILTELSQAVGRFAANPAELLRVITEKISTSLYPNRVAVFLRGYDIVQDEGEEPRLHPMKTDQYFCVWTRRGEETGSPQLSELAFPEDAIIARELEKNQGGEPLEVYLDDPQTWAHALSRADESERKMFQERRLLEQMDTRLVVPLFAGCVNQGFISLGEKLSEEAYSKEDKTLLMTLAQQTAVAVDYAKLISRVAEQERMKREMEIARQVQAQLFPQSLPPMENLDYIGYCKSARGVGGDYYDFLGLRPHLLGIALGDVSGKGVFAALIMAGLQALMRSNAPAHEKALDLLFPSINRLLCSSIARGKYATFFYGVYDSEQRTLDYVNAGHLPPMLFRAGGDVLRLKSGGMVMGMKADAAYEKDHVDLQSGDVLIIYSDGISEAMNVKEEEFGEDRLLELVRPHVHKTAAEIKDVVLAGVKDFVGNAEQNDDITIVVARAL